MAAGTAIAMRTLSLACFLLQVHCAVLPDSSGKDTSYIENIPHNFWYEFSSPYTEAYDEVGEDPGHTPEPLPYFEDSLNSTNVTTQLGLTVFLHCRVSDLSDKTVSWVRRRGDDVHLITFGLHTYSSDSRYSLNYQHPNDWKLQIQFANERDEGHYECRVSSHPPLVHYVYLSVVVPRVEIVDERGLSIPDKFYKAGSTIELKCVISQIPHTTSYVMWKHGNRMLNYDTSRGGISVKTDMQPGGARSRLYIANANRQDSGNYTCALVDVAATSIAVHVLNGENPAAMQHGGGSNHGHSWSAVVLFTLTLLPHLLISR